MLPIARHQDGQTTWRCPVCLTREKTWEETQIRHRPGDLTCLQNQLISLQETVSRIVDKIGDL